MHNYERYNIKNQAKVNKIKPKTYQDYLKQSDYSQHTKNYYLRVFTSQHKYENRKGIPRD